MFSHSVPNPGNPPIPPNLPMKMLPDADSGDFLTFPATATRSSELCCNDDHILSCTEVQFDPKKLSQQTINILDIEFSFANEIEPHGFVYKNDLGDEAIIDYHEDTGVLFGIINTHDGKS